MMNLDEPVYISSNSANEIREVIVRGRDAYGNEITEVVKLNGTTPVVTKNSFNVFYPDDVDENFYINELK